MCGRYVTRIEAALEREWTLKGPVPLFESFNVAPTQSVPVVRVKDGVRECVLMRWGLVPYWARGLPPRFSTINARVETLETAASWRGPWSRGQRCILPAMGFYEWQVREGGKQPYYIHLPDRPIFGFAGLWDRSTAADGRAIESCTIVTMQPNALLAEIHNTKQRMPAILTAEDHGRWLSGDPTAAMECLQPYPTERIAAYTVSTRVNSPDNDDAGLLEAVSA